MYVFIDRPSPHQISQQRPRPERSPRNVDVQYRDAHTKAQVSTVAFLLLFIRFSPPPPPPYPRVHVKVSFYWKAKATRIRADKNRSLDQANALN